MRSLRGEHAPQLIQAFLVLGLGVLAFGFLLHFASPTTAFLGVLAICILMLSFIKMELAVALMLMAMLLSPEIRLGAVGNSLIGDRNVVLRIEDILIPLLGFLWVANAVISGSRKLFVRSPLNLPILVTIAFNLITSARAVILGAPLAKTFFVNLKFIEFYFIYFFACVYFDSRYKIKLALGVMFLTAVAVMIYAVPMIPKTELLTVNRLTAPFEGSPEPGTLGGYLCMVLAILLGFFYFQAGSIEQKFFLVLCIGLSIVLILYTLSRTSYGALVAVLFAVGVLARKPLLILGLLLAVVLAPLVLPEKIEDRITSTLRPGTTWGLEQGAVDRIQVWKKTIFLWKSHPFIGQGVGTTDMMDSEYPRLLMETGVVGLALFLWLQCRLFLMSYRLYRTTEDPLTKAMALGYLCGQAGLLVHCFGAVTFCIVRIMEPFWLFTGMMVGLRELEFSKAEQENETEEGQPLKALRPAPVRGSLAVFRDSLYE